jgi:hypothetical protein
MYLVISLLAKRATTGVYQVCYNSVTTALRMDK